MKYAYLLLPVFFSLGLNAQTSILGEWQLVNQTSCIDDEFGPEDEDVQELMDAMKGNANAKPQVIEFKANNTGKESTKIISKRKSYNSHGFLYRIDGRGLYFLDKRSQTIIEGYEVEKLASDTLIITNRQRVCDTKVFVRIK